MGLAKSSQPDGASNSSRIHGAVVRAQTTRGGVAPLCLCSKSTGAVTSCARKYSASARYFRATAVINPPASAQCTWRSSSARPDQALRRHATPRCSWEIRLFEVAHGIPSSPFSVSSRYGAGLGRRGLLYCSATRSQKADGFRGLADLLGSVGDDTKGESGHIYLSVLLGGPIRHHAGKLGHLGQPSTVGFSLENYAKGFAIGRVGNGCHGTSCRIRRD